MNDLNSTTTFALRRSVPYMVHSTRHGRRVILLDRYEFEASELHGNGPLLGKLRHSLSLRSLGELISADTAIELLSGQFAAASEFVYGHPLWEDMRGGSTGALHAYLLETRHYLAAAASRMSPSIGQGIGLSPLVLLLSRHFLEEWDHGKFFAASLKAIGCATSLTNRARPMPATLEWIHATRAIGYKSGLSAAVCSGFMEYSSTETEAVRSWHAMLVDSGMLTAGANAAIFEHVETDLEFGHSDNWHHVIDAVGSLTSREVADLLNDVGTIAEMIYRWLTALRDGASRDIVSAIQTMTDLGCLLDGAEAHEHDVAAFRGLPVWPSGVLAAVNGAISGTLNGRMLVAGAYAFGAYHGDLAASGSELTEAMARATSSLTSRDHRDAWTPELLSTLASGWLRAIDGHALWDAMADNPTDHLIGGYMVENYHYLASAARHVGAAISACPDATLRIQLIDHFADELEHCDILKAKLADELGIADAHTLRPLPTTVAFVGHLEALGRSDWKAYLVVSAFLQNSLSACRSDGRNRRFYEKVHATCSPQAARVLGTMRQHDEIDGDLGHDAKPLERFASLLAVGQVPRDSIEQAAMAPGLAWGFLDGILQHYSVGAGAVDQRIGWIAG